MMAINDSNLFAHLMRFAVAASRQKKRAISAFSF
jgi:hypothetical protein